jgi:hypothetical protein
MNLHEIIVSWWLIQWEEINDLAHVWAWCSYNKSLLFRAVFCQE